MADRPTVVVLGCVSALPHGRHQLTTLRAQAARRGVRLVGADDRARLAAAPPDEPSLAGLETVAVPVDDPVTCARALVPLAPRAVVTYREAYVLLTAQVSRELGLPGNDPSAVERVRNKDVLRRLLAAHGRPQPTVHVVTSVDEAVARADFGASPRWVVKPRDGSGSEGVAAVADAAALRAAAHGLEGRPFLVEEFVDGPEFSVEGVFLGGDPHVLAVTAKRVNPAFVELGHRMPAGLAPDAEAAARSAVEDALRLSGLSHGIFHVELWWSAGRVVLGEVHVRPGGDYLHLLLAATRPGLELYGLLVDDVLGVRARPADVPEQRRHAGIDYLELPPGRVGRVDGWSQVLGLPGLLVADLGVRPGDLVRPVTDSGGRHGCVAVAADAADAVEALLAAARDAVRVSVVGPHPRTGATPPGGDEQAAPTS